MQSTAPGARCNGHRQRRHVRVRRETCVRLRAAAVRVPRRAWGLGWPRQGVVQSAAARLPGGRRAAGRVVRTTAVDDVPVGERPGSVSSVQCPATSLCCCSSELCGACGRRTSGRQAWISTVEAGLGRKQAVQLVSIEQRLSRLQQREQTREALLGAMHG